MLSIMFNGHNHAVCKAFLGDNFDNTLDYPNAKTANGFEEVFKGDLIQKDENGSIAIIHPTDNPDGTTDAEEKVTITKTTTWIAPNGNLCRSLLRSQARS